MADDRLRIVIEAVDQASAQLAKIKGSLDSVGKEGEAATGLLSGGFLKMAGSMAVGLGVVTTVEAGIRAFVGVMSDAVKGVASQEVAEVRLVQAMKNRGQATEAALESSRALAGELSRLTGIEDDLILKGQATLVAFGKLSGEGLARATRAAVDLAAQGKDLETVFQGLARAAGGNTDRLRSLNIQIDESVPKAERFAEALRQIEANAGGSAAALGGTLQGSMTRIATGFGEVAENGLDAFFKMAGLKRGLQEVADYMQVAALLAEGFAGTLGGNVADAMVKGSQATEVQIDLLAELAGLYEQLGLSTLSTLREKSETVLATQAKLAEAFEAGRVSVEEYNGQLKVLAGQARTFSEQGIGGKALADLAAKAETAKKKVKEFKEELANFPETFEEHVKRMTGVTLPAFATEAKGIADAMALVRMQMAATGDTSGALAAQMLVLIEMAEKLEEAGFDVPFFEIVRAGEEAVTAWEEFELTLKNIIANQVSQLGGQLVYAALSGERAFSKFFTEFLKQIAAAIVQALILQAIMSYFGIGLGGASGGEVQGVARAQVGGQVGGPRLRRDMVPALLMPGEVIIRTPVVEEIEKQLLAGRDRGPARRGGAEVAGFHVTNNFTRALSRADVEAFVKKQNELAEHLGLRVVATEVLE